MSNNQGGALTEDDYKLYETYRDYVKHEDILRGQRTGWLLTGQGFLFAALGASFSAPAQASGRFPSVAFGLTTILLGMGICRTHQLRYNRQNEVYSNLDSRYASATFSRTTPLPPLRYGGASKADSWFRFWAYHELFLSAWIVLLVLLLGGLLVTYWQSSSVG